MCLGCNTGTSIGASTVVLVTTGMGILDDKNVENLVFWDEIFRGGTGLRLFVSV